MLSAKFFLAVQLDLCVDNMATTKACIFGMPVWDIAIGPLFEERAEFVLVGWV